MTQGGATIEGARIAAAHDGAAELIVVLKYDNGATHEVTLDEAATSELMSRCNATTLEELNGHSWELVREALQVSYNRYQAQPKV